RELFETTIAYRGNALNRASEVVPDQQLSAQMDDADTGLGLLTIVVHDQQGFERGRGVLGATHFRQLFEQCAHWAHFRNHPRYIAAREAEKNLLIEAAKSGDHFASDIVESMRPWSGFVDELSPERADLKRTVMDALCMHIFDDLLSRFSRKDGVSTLWGKKRHLTEKYFLLKRDGGFYTQARKDILSELAEQASSSSIIQENFYEYLRLFAYGLKG